ncbi:MAG: cysteine desulfurase [Planctomycetaceae bacterium]
MSQTMRQSRFDVDVIRRDFPILHKPLPNGMPLVYLDNGASAQKPKVVIEKEIEVYENYYANAYRGVYQFGARIDEEFEKARRKIQELLGAAEPEEIIFTSGTTMSINLVANAWGRRFLRAGDELLVNEMEHHANLVPWQQIAAEKGAILRYIPLTADGRLDLLQLDAVLNTRTKLVAVTGMSNVLGTINPIESIVERAKECGSLVLVDGAQSVPHFPVDVKDPPIDFLAFSGHKLYGPSGVGVLYGRRELLELMDPFLTGGHMIDRVYRDHATWAVLPAKFEAGTLPIAQAIALGAAVDYLNGIGFDAICEHEDRLLRYAHERLRTIPGLTIYGPDPEHKGSIVSFNVKGAHPEDLAQLLDRKGVFVRHGHHCTMPLHDLLCLMNSVRASFALYNTEAEIDALVDAIHFARQKLRLE